MDEKTQIQALDRAQPILSIRPGLPEGRTHDYRRKGQIDLFTAFNILGGTVISEFHPGHCHREFLVFLRNIDEHVDPELEVHPVLDNLSAHKHGKVERWFSGCLGGGVMVGRGALSVNCSGDFWGKLP